MAAAVTLSGGGSGTLRCILWSFLVLLVVSIVGGITAVAIVTSRGAVAPPPQPPSPPPPPGGPPPPLPRSPFTEVISDGTPFAHNDVTGLKVTWDAASANVNGWPTGQSELLYMDWSATSDGATPVGLGYKLSLYSGGSYATVTTGTMESTCRATCVNRETTWRTADDQPVAQRCQHFTIVDQSTVAGTNRVTCVFFRGGFPQLHLTTDSGLPTGTDTYVYSVVPFHSS